MIGKWLLVENPDDDDEFQIGLIMESLNRDSFFLVQLIPRKNTPVFQKVFEVDYLVERAVLFDTQDELNIWVSARRLGEIILWHNNDDEDDDDDDD
jgi:hypothetical protein